MTDQLALANEVHTRESPVISTWGQPARKVQGIRGSVMCSRGGFRGRGAKTPSRPVATYGEVTPTHR